MTENQKMLEPVFPKNKGAIFHIDFDAPDGWVSTTFIKNMDVVEIGSFLLSCMEQIPIEQQRAILISCLEVIFRKASDLSEGSDTINKTE